jgi:hypothetical protein
MSSSVVLGDLLVEIDMSRNRRAPGCATKLHKAKFMAKVIINLLVAYVSL